MRRSLAAGAGGVVAAILGSLCCIGSLLFVTFGVGAGLASTFEPLRPAFGVLMTVLLGIAFYTVYGRPSSSPEIASGECIAGESCVAPRHRTRDRVLVWTAAILAAALWTFPTWSVLFV